MFDTTNAQEKRMSPYKFAGLPSNSSVAAGVTLLACGWFLVAGAAIVADKADGPVAVAAPVAVASATPAPQADMVPVVQIAPEARLRIVVEARRA